MSKNDKEKIKQKPGQILKNNWLMIKAVARYIPQYPFFMVLEGVVWGLINSASAIFTIRLFNLLDEENVAFSKIAAAIGIMALFYLIAYIFDAWYWQFYNTVMFQKLQYNMQREMYEKALTVDLACYDDPEFYNDYVFAMDQARNKAWEVTENIGKMINRIISAATVLTVMATVNVWISLMLAVYAVLNFFIRSAYNKVNYKKEVEQRPFSRKNEYINRQFHLADAAKEIHVCDVDENLTTLYDSTVEQMVASDIKYGRKLFPIDFSWSFLESGGMLAIMSVSLVSLIQGEIQLGGFAASVTALWEVGWSISNLIERFQKFPEQSLYIEKYLKFMSIEPTVVGGKRVPDDFETLEFKNVTFAYPFGKHENVLSNINFCIHRHERIALVGYNGAGKTTLTKLIMRLYDPTEGEILYNGINIKEFDLAAYREKISTVFQDFRIFAATVAENVANGPYDEGKREEIERALRMATFGDKLEKLPDGIDTELTREFNDNGVNLSGGESQKVAIARVFAHKCQLVIMDEPSSALDPEAEYDLNNTLIEYTGDKTVVFISHRLSTTRMADRIVMFESGRIIECGSHDELMEKGGKYAEMFELQAQKYRMSKVDSHSVGA